MQSDERTPPPSSFDQAILDGSTCWKRAPANRFAFIVDAADHFRAVKAAILNARKSVFLIGWDFDTRVRLEPAGATLPGPDKVGQLLIWAARSNPDLHIRVLQWDLGTLRGLRRGQIPLALANLMNGDRVRLKLDGAHPPGAAHRQKLVVVDDRIAFCGGIDATTRRWDTSEHLDDNPYRIDPGGRTHGPWHDASACLDGEAARMLGELARERWRNATGETLSPESSDADPWPEFLQPTFQNVEVAIARTQGAHRTQPLVTEIERMYHAAIRAARRTIYVESQYFASRRIAEGLAARLEEPDGPEIILINPETADGWLESKTMDSARARLLKLMRDHDRFGRFRAFHPITAGGAPIYVHAKVLIIDDRLLKVGSSNFNNRSLGFDSECDVVVEAVPGKPDEDSLKQTIVEVRNGLVAEHLGVSDEEVAQALAHSSGSLIRAIDTFQPKPSRLLPLEPRPLHGFEKIVVESDLLDPEPRTAAWMDLSERFRSRAKAGRKRRLESR